MGLYDYNILPDEQKAIILWDKGVFIMNRYHEEFSINLYSLFDFYVEVWYEDTINSINKFRTFKSASQLNPYIDRINLDL
jgi:hypothetical protein